MLRTSDQKEFFLPLVDLEACDKDAEGAQEIGDYGMWIINYRVWVVAPTVEPEF